MALPSAPPRAVSLYNEPEMNRERTRRQHAKVTISDVAQRANVSPMTVSRVINGRENVRDSTREAVMAAIDVLGYSPNKAARSLARARQMQIGLLYDNPSSVYLSAMLLGVLEQARQSDTQVVVVECETEEDGLEAIRTLGDRGIGGILLSPPLADTPSVLKLIEQSRTPAVTIGTRQGNVPSVTIDDYQAARAMTQHIISLGHRRIGFIIGNPEQISSRERLQGFRDTVREAGLEIPEELIVQGRFSYRSGLEAAGKLLDLEKVPTAIFASNDDMAAATVAMAHRYSIDVPHGLTVCGFDDTLLATAVWPEITTIHQPIAKMAHLAIELLEKSIQRRRAAIEAECEHIELDFHLVRRQSDAPPPQ